MTRSNCQAVQNVRSTFAMPSAIGVTTILCRSGTTAVQGGTVPQSLWEAIIDWPAPTRTDAHDGLRLSSGLAPHGGQTEKKSSAHLHSPVCQQYDRPFLVSSCTDRAMSALWKPFNPDPETHSAKIMPVQSIAAAHAIQQHVQCGRDRC